MQAGECEATDDESDAEEPAQPVPAKASTKPAAAKRKVPVPRANVRRPHRPDSSDEEEASANARGPPRKRRGTGAAAVVDSSDDEASAAARGPPRKRRANATPADSSDEEAAATTKPPAKRKAPAPAPRAVPAPKQARGVGGRKGTAKASKSR